MIRQNKDKNERFVITIYEGLGLYPQQMDRTAGFDLLVHGVVKAGDGDIICTGPWVVEVKSSRAKARLNKLTDNEHETRAVIENVGGVYSIVISGPDALGAIGFGLNHLDNLQLWKLETALSDYLNTDIDVDVLPMVRQFYNQVILEMTGDKTDE